MTSDSSFDISYKKRGAEPTIRTPFLYTFYIGRIMLWQLFTSFMKIGAFTLGGGYAMLPIIEAEVVAKRQWITAEDFLDMVVLAQTAPGILAMNISILVGEKVAGKRGAIVSALGAGLPSFTAILLFAFQR